MMPKYLFKHNQNSGSLYSPFYQYFLARWNHPDIPEYDFATDELIYRDTDGNEVRREKFEDPMEDTWREAENESPRDVERKLAEINQDSSETVEKGEFGSAGPPRAPFFSLAYLVRSISIQLNG